MTTAPKRKKIAPADQLLAAAQDAGTQRRSLVARARHLAAVAVYHDAGDLAATISANTVEAAQALANLEWAYRAAAGRITQGGGRG